MTSRYTTGKIYTIRSHQTDQIYIGSTCLPLHKRLFNHRNSFKNYKVGHPYYSSFEIIKYPDNYIELLELFPCGSKSELCKREGELIRSNNCVNKNIAGRTNKEWRTDNAQKLKQYNTDNAETIKIQRKQYNIDNASKIKIQKKQYGIDNSDRIKNKRNQYHIDYAEKLFKPCVCFCGGKFTNQNKSTHFKTKKHVFYQHLLDFILS